MASIENRALVPKALRTWFLAPILAQYVFALIVVVQDIPKIAVFQSIGQNFSKYEWKIGSQSPFNTRRKSG